MTFPVATFSIDGVLGSAQLAASTRKGDFRPVGNSGIAQNLDSFKVPVARLRSFLIPMMRRRHAI